MGVASTALRTAWNWGSTVARSAFMPVRGSSVPPQGRWAIGMRGAVPVVAPDQVEDVAEEHEVDFAGTAAGGGVDWIVGAEQLEGLGVDVVGGGFVGDVEVADEDEHDFSDLAFRGSP